MSRILRRSVKLPHNLKKTAKPFKAVLLGPPGSYKTALADKIGKAFHLYPISVRERINENIEKDSKFGRLAKMCIEKQTLVPNDIMLTFITKEILEAEITSVSWLVSGFPVTETQAKMFWETVKIHMAIHVKFPEDVLVNNLTKRFTQGKDDKALSKDLLNLIRRLLDNYEQITKPMFNFYLNHNVLHTFYSNNYEDLWSKMEKSLENHIAVIRGEDIH